MTNKRILTALTAIAIGGFLLSGCTPAPSESPSPTVSATPTPTASGGTTAAPKSEAEAVKSAEATLAAYNKAYDQIGIDGWTNTERLRDFATEEQYSSTLAGLEASKRENRTQSGFATLTVQDAQVVDANGGVQYGSVLIRACFDPSTRGEKLADGSAAPLPTPVRSIKEASVTYSTDVSKWLVASFVTPPSGRQEC